MEKLHLKRKDGTERKPNFSMSSYQPHFLPHAYIVARALSGDMFILSDDVDFDRNHWQHRCELPDGKKLTIPVTKNDDGKKIYQRTIFYGDGSYEQILPTLERLYKDLPYYKEIYEVVAPHINARYATLGELNCKIVEEILKRLDGSLVIKRATEIRPEGSNTDRLVSLCKKLQVLKYIAGQSAIDGYLEMDKFAQEGIEVRPQNWSGDNENIFEFIAKRGFDEAVIDLFE